MWLIKVFSAICKFLGNSFFNLNRTFVINIQIFIFLKKILPDWTDILNFHSQIWLQFVQLKTQSKVRIAWPVVFVNKVH